MSNFKQNLTGSNQPRSGIDGLIRRSRPSPGGSGRNRSSLTTKDTLANFNKPEGFTARNRGSQSGSPDGTQLGRRPVYKKDLDLSLPGGVSSRKMKNPKKRDRKKVFKRAALSLVTIAILVGGYMIGSAFLQVRSVFQGGSASNVEMCEDIQPADLIEEDQCRMNILVLGVDDAASLTDSMIVASIDPIDNSAKLISIPRDTYVQLPSGGQSKINAVYSLEKQNALVQGQNDDDAETTAMKGVEETVEDILDIEINYYVTINFEAFERAIDTVGGVTVNVQEPLYDQTMAHLNNGNPLLAPAGEQNFDGYRALMYARSRLGSARGDFDRSERQREIMLALRNKVFSLGTFGNPVKISQLMDAFGDNVRTNLSLDDVRKLYDVAGRIDDSRVESIGLADPPIELLTTGMYDGQSVVYPVLGIFQFQDVQQYIASILVDGFIKRENPTVAILNGTTTPGLAGTYEQKLTQLGYNVVQVGDAPNTDYQSTEFISLAEDKPYTERYMELRFKTETKRNLPSGMQLDQVDFVIILGNNETFNN